MTPLRHAGARHVIRNVGLLQHLANELRAEPVGVREVTTGVAPPLEVVEGETVLGVVPDITGKQRNLHALGIELCLHGVAFQLLRIHAAVTVTQCLLGRLWELYDSSACNSIYDSTCIGIIFPS